MRIETISFPSTREHRIPVISFVRHLLSARLLLLRR